MVLQIEIEYWNPIFSKIENDYNIVDVNFEGFPDWQDDSYDDEYGTVSFCLRPSMENSEIYWYKKNFTQVENDAIQSYLNDNYNDVCQKFCDAFLLDEKNNF